MADPMDLDRLLADCRLVVAYGVRSGRLPDGGLLAALAAAETLVAGGKREQVAQNDLGMELGRAVRALAPVTLEDLGSGWTPFEGWGHRAMRVILVLVAGVLILATSYYSQLYTQASSILGQLTEVQAIKLREKSERLFRFYLKNAQQLYVTDKDSNDAVVFEPFLRSYDELMSSYEKLSTYVPLSINLNNRSIGMPIVGDIIDGLRKSLGFKGGQMELVPESQRLPEFTASNAKDNGPSDEPNPELGPLRKKKELLERFLFMLGSDWYYQRLLNTQIYETQRTVAVLGIWILPALYGMLGAMLFQLKAILDPMIPNPPFERLFLCLTLGAFAGVSVFLILGPTPNKIFEGASSGLGAFAICFLLGFSLDVFFSILDRLVTFASQSIRTLGKGPAEKAASGPA